MPTRVFVYQDGNTFINDRTGDELFQSALVVGDGDLPAARDARQEFLDWCDRNSIDPSFV